MFHWPPEVLFCRVLYYFVGYVSHFWHRRQQLLRFVNDVRALQCALQVMFPIRGHYYRHFHRLPKKNTQICHTASKKEIEREKKKAHKLFFWRYLSCVNVFGCFTSKINIIFWNIYVNQHWKHQLKMNLSFSAFAI